MWTIPDPLLLCVLILRVLQQWKIKAVDVNVDYTIATTPMRDVSMERSVSGAFNLLNFLATNWCLCVAHGVRIIDVQWSSLGPMQYYYSYTVYHDILWYRVLYGIFIYHDMIYMHDILIYACGSLLNQLQMHLRIIMMLTQRRQKDLLEYLITFLTWWIQDAFEQF